VETGVGAAAEQLHRPAAVEVGGEDLSVPSLSKSSTTTPPAEENESMPSAGATSVNRPMLSSDSKADGGTSDVRGHTGRI
jgi:hypothetical protein